MLLYAFASVVYWVCVVYTLVLIARMIFDWVRFFAPRWSPRGPLLLLANLVYTLTDPPLRWLRKLIPPLRLGGVALDVGFIVVFVAVSLLSRVALSMMYLAY